MCSGPSGVPEGPLSFPSHPDGGAASPAPSRPSEDACGKELRRAERDLLDALLPAHAMTPSGPVPPIEGLHRRLRARSPRRDRIGVAAAARSDVVGVGGGRCRVPAEEIAPESSVVVVWAGIPRIARYPLEPLVDPDPVVGRPAGEVYEGPIFRGMAGRGRIIFATIPTDARSPSTPDRANAAAPRRVLRREAPCPSGIRARPSSGFACSAMPDSPR